MPDTDEGGWEPLALLGASTLSYVHGDHLGVPVQITDASGAMVNAMKADPFGQRFYTASTSAPRTSLAFPGQIIDIADRHYNLYRDYDPTLGRYLQADPIGLAGGDNVYGYAGGNPVNRVDPRGLQAAIPAPVPLLVPPVVVPGTPENKQFTDLMFELSDRAAQRWRELISAMREGRYGAGRVPISLTSSNACSADPKQACHEKCSAETVGRGYGSDAPGLYRKCMRKCLASKGVSNY
jgi:RHS repeat-associated protein